MHGKEDDTKLSKVPVPGQGEGLADFCNDEPELVACLLVDVVGWLRHFQVESDCE